MNEKIMILQIFNKWDMMMEKIDIGDNFIAIILCLLKKTFLLLKCCICLKNRTLYKVGEKKLCFNALCSLANLCICSHNAKLVMEIIWGWMKKYFNAFVFKMEII